MRTLGELMASRDGRNLLEMHGVLSSQERFLRSVRPPPDPRLAKRVGVAPGRALVYAAHQLMTDYGASVMAKLRATRQVDEQAGIGSVLVWLDMDRTGADRNSAGTMIRGPGGALQIRLASRRHDDKELRFVPLERARLEETVRRIGGWARQHGAVGERLSRFVDVVRDTRTLAEANLMLTSFLLHEHLGIGIPSVLVSDIADSGLLTETIDEVVQAADDVVTVFNAAVDSLVAGDVNPQVHHLRPDYLPLHYSCPRDDRRCTLSRRRVGPDTFAVTRCACGASYRFHLGSRSLSIREVAATGRWSADVTLPLYLNDLSSGVVGGRSSALYGIVLNQVLEKVLARRPIPMFLPPDLSTILAEGAQSETLLQRYVVGA